MDVPAIFVGSLWAGFFSTGLAVLLTAPPNYLGATFICGLAGRVVRDLCTGWGMSHNWATMLAAAVVVLVAAAIVRRHQVSPVVLVCGILPLGAAVGTLNLLFGMMRLSSATGAALDEASLVFTSNLARTFTTSLAIAVGIAGGMALVQFLRREEAVDV